MTVVITITISLILLWVFYNFLKYVKETEENPSPKPKIKTYTGPITGHELREKKTPIFKNYKEKQQFYKNLSRTFIAIVRVSSKGIVIRQRFLPRINKYKKLNVDTGKVEINYGVKYIKF